MSRGAGVSYEPEKGLLGKGPAVVFTKLRLSVLTWKGLVKKFCRLLGKKLELQELITQTKKIKRLEKGEIFW